MSIFPISFCSLARSRLILSFFAALSALVSTFFWIFLAVLAVGFFAGAAFLAPFFALTGASSSDSEPESSSEAPSSSELESTSPFVLLAAVLEVFSSGTSSSSLSSSSMSSESEPRAGPVRVDSMPARALISLCLSGRYPSVSLSTKGDRWAGAGYLRKIGQQKRRILTMPGA